MSSAHISAICFSNASSSPSTSSAPYTSRLQKSTSLESFGGVFDEGIACPKDRSSSSSSSSKSSAPDSAPDSAPGSAPPTSSLFQGGVPGASLEIESSSAAAAAAAAASFAALARNFSRAAASSRSSAPKLLSHSLCPAMSSRIASSPTLPSTASIPPPRSALRRAMNSGSAPTSRSFSAFLIARFSSSIALRFVLVKRASSSSRVSTQSLSASSAVCPFFSSISTSPSLRAFSLVVRSLLRPDMTSLLSCTIASAASSCARYSEFHAPARASSHAAARPRPPKPPPPLAGPGEHTVASPQSLWTSG
eukprot:29403-Pelagococcus_subviridis.AAC.4